MPFLDSVEKYCSPGQATNDNLVPAHCMLDTSGYKHTLTIYNTYRSSTVTTVARTLLNVTLYVHFLSCLCSIQHGLCWN